MAGTTPNFAFRYPSLGDPTRVAGSITDLANDADLALDTVRDASLLKAGDTMTGLLTLSGAPTTSLHAATKLYVDNRTPFEIRGGQATPSVSTGSFAIAHGGGTTPVAFGAMSRNLGAVLLVVANGAADGTNLNFTVWTSFSTKASSGSLAIDWWALFTASGAS